MYFRPGRKMSDRLLEQYINVKFCAKLGKSTSETVAYGADAMKKSRVSLSGIKGLKRVGKM
jgi:hypothetical protein